MSWIRKPDPRDHGPTKPTALEQDEARRALDAELLARVAERCSPPRKLPPSEPPVAPKTS